MAPASYELRLVFDRHPIQVSPTVLGAAIEYERRDLSKRCWRLLRRDWSIFMYSYIRDRPTQRVAEIVGFAEDGSCSPTNSSSSSSRT